MTKKPRGWKRMALLVIGVLILARVIYSGWQGYTSATQLLHEAAEQK